MDDPNKLIGVKINEWLKDQKQFRSISLKSIYFTQFYLSEFCEEQLSEIQGESIK